MPASRMMNHLNTTMHVVVNDGRELSGTLLSFDKHMDLVLGDTVEKSFKNGSVAERSLGLILLRGEHVVSIRGDGAKASH